MFVRQVRSGQRSRQRQRRRLSGAFTALHAAHRGHGPALHPQSVRQRHRRSRPSAARAAEDRRLPGLRRRASLLLRRGPHALPVRAAAGLLRDHVPCVRAAGRRRGPSGGVRHGQAALVHVRFVSFSGGPSQSGLRAECLQPPSGFTLTHTHEPTRHFLILLTAVHQELKETVHLKMKIWSFTHPQVGPNLHECVCSEHKGTHYKLRISSFMFMLT